MTHTPFVSNPCPATAIVFVSQNLFYGQLPQGVLFLPNLQETRDADRHGRCAHRLRNDSFLHGMRCKSGIGSSRRPTPTHRLPIKSRRGRRPRRSAGTSFLVMCRGRCPHRPNRVARQAAHSYPVTGVAIRILCANRFRPAAGAAPCEILFRFPAKFPLDYRDKK